MQELVLFKTGDMDFALDQDDIEEIRPITQNCALARESLQQVIESEGRSLLLIDLASGVTRCPPVPPVSEAKLILVKGTPSFALLADDMKETLQADQGQMEALPAVFSDTARACFPKVLRTKGQLALVVDITALADCKIDMNAVPDHRRVLQFPIEDDNETATMDMALPDTPSLTSGPKALDVMVGEILKKIIEQRVEKKVAETMAQALETSF